MARRAAEHRAPETDEAPETDDPAFEDLLWEFDVTRQRADVDDERAAAKTRRPAPRTPAGPKPFARPELLSPWERLRANLAARILSWTLLVGGTATLVALAVAQR